MKKLDLVYEDKQLLVVNKPPKMLTISTTQNSERTLYQEASAYVKKQHPKNKIFIVHRLDKDTSGIILFAKNEKIKHYLQNNWDNVAIKREYICIVEGVVKQRKGTIVNYLKETKTLQVYDTKNPKIGKKAITNYNVLETTKNYTLLKINIQSGRKNQIRVALSSIGHPIIGDKKYHSTKNPYHRLGLHASILEIKFPEKTLKFNSQIPREWLKDFKEGISIYERENCN